MMELDFDYVDTVEYEKKYTENGYIKIFVEGKWILEHKYVIEKYIGRELTQQESVHHINEMKTDNRLTNLMVFKNSKEHHRFHKLVARRGFRDPRVVSMIINRWEEFL